MEQLYNWFLISADRRYPKQFLVGGRKKRNGWYINSYPVIDIKKDETDLVFFDGFEHYRCPYAQTLFQKSDKKQFTAYIEQFLPPNETKQTIELLTNNIRPVPEYDDEDLYRMLLG